MNDRIAELSHELDQITESTRMLFGNSSPAQLNWQPAPGSWSIAQCLDHLIRINSLYFPLLTALRSGRAQPTFWERYSPLSKVLGKLLIGSLRPEHRKKLKTSPQAQPVTSEVADILDRFAQHQAELIDHLRAIPREIDRERTIVTSPLRRWVTYSLDDCLTILVVHEQRHVLQARRVLEAGPGSAADG
jgi:uncharacterized damage-inducible protein DinB